MDYNNESRYSNWIQILFGVSLISIILGFLFQNSLSSIISTAGLVFYFMPFIGLLGLIVYFAAMGFLMKLMQSNLRQVRQHKEDSISNYLAIFILLLIPAILGGFIQSAHIGFFYALMMLAWSFFVVSLQISLEKSMKMSEKTKRG